MHVLYPFYLISISVGNIIKLFSKVIHVTCNKYVYIVAKRDMLHA